MLHKIKQIRDDFHESSKSYTIACGRHKEHIANHYFQQVFPGNASLHKNGHCDSF